MGMIDKTLHRFTCPQCKARDTVHVVQHGSSYSGSWGTPSETNLFDVQWKTDQMGEPEPTSVVCVKCGVEAKTDSSYSEFKDDAQP
ncbi:MAG: hypothetical protein FD157_3145 [Rhodocyclaceae bacterium]|jgi:Zn ribbon nucleic-acid-binding protein|nr:MAG: hypothetical protein FD157_3145 [Rhodocyclaceae bacterium]TND00457.1 MAG: hypothetical protein FD118_3158 [Rhodocyclaceae bacterium]